jgi:TrmH family RNA methyltransferase
MTITSQHNQRLKEIRKLRMRRRERDRSARFVAEGEDLLAAADAAGWPALERFCVAGSGLEGVEIEPAVLASVSGLASGTRALAVYQERWSPEALGQLCVYLHGVSDPGNVGAVLRSAEAFGASCVAIGPGTADPFSPKAVRASMGAIFAVPVARATAGIADLPGRTIALVAGSGLALADVVSFKPHISAQKTPPPDRPAAPAHAAAPARAAPRTPTTLLIGAEREGLPEALTAQADHVAHIPIATHSLNAAMAATVALYELTRMPPA